MFFLEAFTNDNYILALFENTPKAYSDTEFNHS